MVLIAGAGASGIVARSSGKLMCRFPSQLINGFQCSNVTVSASTPGLTIPVPSLSNASGVPWLETSLPTALVQEFFLTDVNNATAIANATGLSLNDVQAAMGNPASYQNHGQYPSAAIASWTQNPWHPLFIAFSAKYYPISYGQPSSPNWTFNNGIYSWNGSGANSSQYTVIQGIIQLTPAAVFNMESRIQAFLKNNPHLDPAIKAEFEELLNFVQNSDSWDLLSQALNGFNQQLLLNMAGVFMGPDSSSLPQIARLIGDADDFPPGVGPIPTTMPASSLFQPWRCGQFVFTDLKIIDEWGQALWPIGSENYPHVYLYISPDMSPVAVTNAVPLTVSSDPALTAVNPALVAAGGAPFTLTATGAGFVSGAVLQWNSTALNTTFVSATQLTAAVPANLISAVGAASVTVRQTGATSNVLPLVISSAPAIGSLSPSLLQAAMAVTSNIKLVVNGVNFGADAVAYWNNVKLATRFVSSTQVSADIPAALTASPANIAITVVTDGKTSAPVSLPISAGSAIQNVSPAAVAAGAAAFSLAVTGVGFSPVSVVNWNQTPLQTTFVNATQITANVPSTLTAAPADVSITACVGHTVLIGTSDPLVQAPPALLQPARLDFGLVSSTNDLDPIGTTPGANPVCGWVLPNHLDGSLMAYEAGGAALGEMRVAINASDATAVCWTNAPGSPYSGLDQIKTAVPNFGPFLWTLAQQTPSVFTAFLNAIDETMWTTIPMGANFDQSLAVILGRPLAMVRARLQFELNGPPYSDPSWQFTFTPATPAITRYPFAIELGNVAQLEDGLIGYFMGENYTQLNVAQDSGAAASNYLKPIGVNNNYIDLPFDGTTSAFVSMLVDPRAAVHATTAILPTLSLSVPSEFIDQPLNAIDVTFRIDGILTDSQTPAPTPVGIPPRMTILMPVPRENDGVWTWYENDEGNWITYPTAPNDSTARLSNVPPVLRRGFLRLSSALSKTLTTRTFRPARRIESLK